MDPIDELAKRFQRKSRKVPCSFNLPDWLEVALQRTVSELRAKGSKVTKADVVAEALKEFLGVQAPE
jgi:hypothetical protein